MEITIETIYRAFLDSVKYSPKTADTCERLQTFRVFPNSRLPELTTPNLGATICDKGRPFFWSRNWVEAKYNPNKIVWSFPLLFMFDMSAQVSGALSDAPVATHSFQIGVLDVFKDDCLTGKCGGCSGRTINEIHIATQRLLLQSLNFVTGIVYASNITGANPVPTGWYHVDYLKNLVDTGAIDDTYQTEKHLFGKAKNVNNNLFFVHRELAASKIYGTVTEIQIETKACLTPAVNWENVDWGVEPHNVGCNDCG